MATFSSSTFVATTPVNAEMMASDLSTSVGSPENMQASTHPLDETDTSLEGMQGVFSEHRGKLAVGVAATLGLLVFYQWRANNLATQAPDDYRRLQRIRQALEAQTTEDPDTPFIRTPSSRLNEV